MELEGGWKGTRKPRKEVVAWTSGGFHGDREACGLEAKRTGSTDGKRWSEARQESRSYQVGVWSHRDREARGRAWMQGKEPPGNLPAGRNSSSSHFN